MKDEPLTLVRPQAKYENSFRAGFEELESSSDQDAWVYMGEKDYPTFFKMTFDQYVNLLLERETNPPSHFVRDTVYWAIKNEEVVGRISIRHELNDFLKKAGGHVGYIVRPSARGHGIATEMLRLILKTPKAKEIGQILLTCDEENIASAKTILKNGGKHTDTTIIQPELPRKKHYWIDASHL